MKESTRNLIRYFKNMHRTLFEQARSQPHPLSVRINLYAHYRHLFAKSLWKLRQERQSPLATKEPKC